MSLPKLPRPYLTILANLYEAGGSADVDTYGRLTVGPTKHPLPGDSPQWMRLVARGLVAGEGDKIILTEAGRQEAKALVVLRNREANV